MENENQRQTIAEEKAQGVRHPSRRRSRLSQADKKTLTIIGISIASVVLLIGILAGAYFILVDQTALIQKNVCVAGVNVGGLTKQEAISLVSRKVGDSYETTAMVVTIQDKSVEIPASVSHAKLNVKKAVSAALNYKKSGLLGNAVAPSEPVNLDISPYLSLDERAIRETLNTLAYQFSSGLTQTIYSIEGDIPSLTEPTDTSKSMTLVVKKGTPEYSLNLNELYTQVLQAYSERNFAPELECAYTEPDELDLEAIYSQYCIEPVDAYINTETFEVVPEVYGYAFDLDAARKTLEKTGYGEEVQIPFSYIDPKVLQESLSQTLYSDTLGSSSLKYGSASSRNANLSTACKALNDFVIFPGETFSFNREVGPVSSANGYKSADCCVGETGQEVGGGLCQVASALYSCVLQAELDILEAHPHEFAQEYAEIGLDVEIVWGDKDLQFTNNTNYPIRMEASSSKGNVTVKLIGTNEKDYTVKLETKVTKTKEYAIIYKTMQPDNAEGYKDGDVITAPITGYVVDIYRRQTEKTGAYDVSVPDSTREYAVRDKVVCSIAVPPADPNSGGAGDNDTF